jgi:hypothetical protein
MEITLDIVSCIKKYNVSKAGSASVDRCEGNDISRLDPLGGVNLYHGQTTESVQRVVYTKNKSLSLL